MRAKLGAWIVVCCLIVTPISSAERNEDTWTALKHITRARDYTLLLRDGTCYVGQIRGLDDKSMTLRRRTGATLTIQREDVRRLGEEIEIDETVYSGRSSWLDVEGLPLNSKEHTRVLMKDGKRHEGRLIRTTAVDVTLLENGLSVELAKEGIAKVYFLRLRPWSASEQFRMQEDFIFFVFDPKFWSMELNVGAKIPVLLYDDSMTEDNSISKCVGLPS